MLVGVDGSPGSYHALRWAVDHADRFGTVQPLTTWSYPWWAYSAPIPPDTEEFRDAAIRAANDAVESVRSRCLPPIVCRGHAGQTLVDVGETAGLIVVGTRGRGAVADTVLGSVSTHVVAHSVTPVVVVPPSAPADQQFARVVVGIDGSVNSLRALRWAIENTDPAVPIEAVHSWVYPVSDMPDLATIPRDVYEDQARFTLDESVDAVHKAAGFKGHRVERKLAYGDARSVLRDLAQPDDLLVLGARGRGGVLHLLLGSVTTALIHQPTVTTVVVPSRPDDDDA